MADLRALRYGTEQIRGPRASAENKLLQSCKTVGGMGGGLRGYDKNAAGPPDARGRAFARAVCYFGSIATRGSRFFGSGSRVPGGTRVISSTTLSLNGVGIPTWRPWSET
jgi:hypothetical protein